MGNQWKVGVWILVSLSTTSRSPRFILKIDKIGLIQAQNSTIGRNYCLVYGKNGLVHD